jgi:NAD+ kinase
MSVRRVGVIAKEGLTAAAPHLAAVAGWLHARGVETVFEIKSAALAGLSNEPTLARDQLIAQVDLLLVLGGDGTMLGTAARVGEAGLRTPILGVNFGRLGFLTEVTLEELYPELEAVLEGRSQIHERRLLHATTLRAGQPRAEHVVLNDVVVTRGEVSRVIELSVNVDDRFVTRVKADGIIIASPTGSTAYNLSSGGPVLVWGLDAMAVTFVSPHSLHARPLVVPRGLELVVRNETNPDREHTVAKVIADGVVVGELAPGRQAAVRLGDRRGLLALLPEMTFFHRYRDTFAS